MSLPRLAVLWRVPMLVGLLVVSLMVPLVGASPTVAVTPDGRWGWLKGWGLNVGGRLAISSPTTPYNVLLPTSPAGSALPDGEWVDMSAADHVLALNADGHLWSWGSNVNGLLGTGLVEQGANGGPAQVPFPAGESLSGISAGYSHDLVVTTGGDVWTWGGRYTGFDEEVGPTYEYQKTPTRVPGLSNVRAVDAGYNFSVALKADGTVWTWGANNYGQLGQGSEEELGDAPAKVPGLSGVTAVAASGDRSAFALKADGTVWGWGNNDLNQVSDAADAPSVFRSPTPVPRLDRVTAIAAGVSHTVALREDGTVLTWGYNGIGQLGQDPQSIDRDGPRQVAGLPGPVDSVSAGFDTTFAVVDGRAYGWGRNNYGELGDGDGTDTWWASPRPVSGLDRVTKVAPGHLFTLAINEPAADTTDPAVTLTAPRDGASYSLGQAVTAAYDCTDSGGSGLASCLGPVRPGLSVDTSTPGTHSFAVTATDRAGNTTTRTVSYTVAAGDVAASVTGGDTVSTDPGQVGATPDVPLQTSITVPNGISGNLTVTPGASTAAPAGYSLFGQEVVIEGPVTTASAPYTMTFTVDASALGATLPENVQVFRNGSAASPCTDPVAAVPDPCVAARGAVPGGEGDAYVTVRTSHFSTWSLGRLEYGFKGLYQPVDNAPVVNSVRAGSAVPVMFSLTGNRGLDIFTGGSPTTVASSCGRGRTDDVEVVVPATSSFLVYDRRHDTYAYVWKTAKDWRGCRTLILRFRDGTVKTALFTMKR